MDSSKVTPSGRWCASRRVLAILSSSTLVCLGVAVWGLAGGEGGLFIALRLSALILAVATFLAAAMFLNGGPSYMPMSTSARTGRSRSGRADEEATIDILIRLARSRRGRARN